MGAFSLNITWLKGLFAHFLFLILSDSPNVTQVSNAAAPLWTVSTLKTNLVPELQLSFAYRRCETVYVIELLRSCQATKSEYNASPYLRNEETR